MKLSNLMIIGVFGLLSGCSAVNSQFSCNETASDRCMTIEQVDKMTSFADDYNRAPYQSKFGSRQAASQKSAVDNKENTEIVWVAPWKDSKGHAHNEQVITRKQAKA